MVKRKEQWRENDDNGKRMMVDVNAQWQKGKSNGEKKKQWQRDSNGKGERMMTQRRKRA